MFIRVEDEFLDSIIVARMISDADTCIWSINKVIDKIIAGENKSFHYEDIYDNFNTLMSINGCLQYYGKEPVKYFYHEAKFGHNAKGEPFDKEKELGQKENVEGTVRNKKKRRKRKT